MRDLRIDGSADLRQRIDLMREAPDGTVWVSVMGLELQQRSAEGRLLHRYPLEYFRGTADAPIEQIRFDAHGRPWVMGDMGIWREQAGRFEAVPGVSRGRSTTWCGSIRSSCGWRAKALSSATSGTA